MIKHTRQSSILVVLRKCYYFDHSQKNSKQTKTNNPKEKKSTSKKVKK